MLAPIAMLVLVDQMSVRASEYIVSATVPAPLPPDAPIITSPQNNAVVHSPDTSIKGTCPVVTPAVIITIYEDANLLGSVVCGTDGSFIVPVTLPVGSHTIQAKVLTITGQNGAASDGVTIVYSLPASSQIVSDQRDRHKATDTTAGTPGIGLPVRITPASPYVLIDPTGNVIWKGIFSNGSSPYKVSINWGDGSTDVVDVRDNSEQSFSHHYTTITTYTIVIDVTDAEGETATMYSVAVTYRTQQNLGLGVDSHLPSVSPFVSFIERYMWYIYVMTLSSLVFLWYIEHGRHLAAQAIFVTKKRPRQQKRR